MSIEDEIAATMAEQIAKEIDREIVDTIMIDVLKSEGWTGTTVNPAFGKSIVPEIDWYTETAEWIHINATGDYKLLRGQWLFKNQEDAIMFTLRWS